MVTYGVQDGQDIRAWADWMQAQPGNQHLYGFGASLGASALLGSLKTERRFRAVIAESAFTDFPAIARERIARNTPAQVRWLTVPFVDSGLLWARLRYGVDMRDSSALAGVRKTKTPLLIAHGLEDDLTSPDNSRALAAANPAVAELWLVPGAGHANLWATVRPEFERRTLAWFAAH
jgi:pimeloyl-ACP methyl ester carboxylesterase